jgi:ribonuclease E
MSDTHSHDDHWRRLAAELGLDAGPPPEQPVAEAPSEPFVPEQEPARDRGDVESPRTRRRRPVEPEHELDEAPPAVDVGLFDATGVPPAEAEIEGSDVEAAAVPEVRHEEVEEASDDLADQQTGKRRRRRRSRRKKKGETAPEGATGDEPAEDAAAASADEDDEPVEDLGRNWNVPSWDDLIGSLYRPER